MSMYVGNNMHRYNHNLFTGQALFSLMGLHVDFDQLTLNGKSLDLQPGTGGELLRINGITETRHF